MSKVGRITVNSQTVLFDNEAFLNLFEKLLKAEWDLDVTYDFAMKAKNDNFFIFRQLAEVREDALAYYDDESESIETLLECYAFELVNLFEPFDLSFKQIVNKTEYFKLVALSIFIKAYLKQFLILFAQVL